MACQAFENAAPHDSRHPFFIRQQPIELPLADLEFAHQAGPPLTAEQHFAGFNQQRLVGWINGEYVAASRKQLPRRVPEPETKRKGGQTLPPVQASLFNEP